MLLSTQGLINAAVVIVAVLSVGYVFAKVTQATSSFTKGILAASLTIDFYLIIMWLLGIDRPMWVLCTRVGCVTLTALTLFMPFKLLFTLYIFIKSRQLQEQLG